MVLFADRTSPVGVISSALAAVAALTALVYAAQAAKAGGMRSARRATCASSRISASWEQGCGRYALPVRALLTLTRSSVLMRRHYVASKRSCKPRL